MEARNGSAGVVRRSLAAVIDLGVVVATLYALQAAVSLSMVGTWPGSLMRGEIAREAAVSLVVAVAYSAECWSRSGRTAGAVALGLRVVARDGLPLRPAEAIMRAVACVIFPFGLLTAVVDRKRRSLQDLAFGSRVVYERSFRAAAVGAIDDRLDLTQSPHRQPLDLTQSSHRQPAGPDAELTPATGRGGAGIAHPFRNRRTRSGIGAPAPE
jgi:uncharacterized RDD family membrane protein YckC